MQGDLLLAPSGGSEMTHVLPGEASSVTALSIPASTVPLLANPTTTTTTTDANHSPDSKQHHSVVTAEADAEDEEEEDEEAKAGSSRASYTEAMSSIGPDSAANSAHPHAAIAQTSTANGHRHSDPPPRDGVLDRDSRVVDMSRVPNRGSHNHNDDNHDNHHDNVNHDDRQATGLPSTSDKQSQSQEQEDKLPAPTATTATTATTANDDGTVHHQYAQKSAFERFAASVARAQDACDRAWMRCFTLFKRPQVLERDVAWWNADDFWPCWVGFVGFAICTAFVSGDYPVPAFQAYDTDLFYSIQSSTMEGLPVLFGFMLVLLWIALACQNAKGWEYFPFGFGMVWLLSLLAKMIAKQRDIKSASLGDSIWAIFLGMFFSNFVWREKAKTPKWVAISMQTELYIATSLVLLCIDFSVLGPLAPRAIVVAWIDTPIFFILMSFFGFYVLGINIHSAIIMAGTALICGSSAAIALTVALNVRKSVADIPIAISSLLTVPSIIGLPFLANALGLSADASGAWFGGCVDSTGAVIATATIYGTDAVNASAVVKMIQNVLIAPLSVLVAVFWLKYGAQIERIAEQRSVLHAAPTESATEIPMQPIKPVSNGDVEAAAAGTGTAVPPQPAEAAAAVASPAAAPAAAAAAAAAPVNHQWGKLLWKRLPKFVLGFVLITIIFNLAVPSDMRTETREFCFVVAEWFSTCSFISIGLGMRILELSRGLQLIIKLFGLYIITQIIDIIITAGLSYAVFS
ncbi:hypothetical protein CAOG_07561 [Capsaspora owczarzaki ATCC 30864]|uniref:Uncharacterized protein n=1 Tax=Capsaspora owczarzaki (strain ATCC 30864) TaxID=595528 RepID=A0A0D2WW15_CAPO3|nr:hypothetical protein CAOG_07561 [Capsaspora owczarzaki ATCC 30864]KJE97090.1 hypothetical protein CAOG_007561 [Capsaspora owczarzaki ATCC 30864]|eukprot:XP_004343435.2 hypothetical protein CAOG_07561 [Capsaspora owczarzaki ATCC 30864]